MWAVELKRYTYEQELGEKSRNASARRRANRLLRGGDRRVCKKWDTVTLSDAQETAAKLFLEGKRCVSGRGL